MLYTTSVHILRNRIKESETETANANANTHGNAQSIYTHVYIYNEHFYGDNTHLHAINEMPVTLKRCEKRLMVPAQIKDKSWRMRTPLSLYS